MLSARIERWPIAGSFTISRGAKTEAVTVVAEVSRGGLDRPRRMRPLSALWRDPGSDAGRPPGHAGAVAARARPPGPAGRDACRAPPATRWIARCWTSRPRPAASGSGTCSDAPRPIACITAYTISLASPEAMAAATARAAHRPLLKIKLGGDGDGARIAAVRKAAPDSELIVDANEAWTSDNLEQNLGHCAQAGVTLVEQPLPAGQDEALARIRRPLAVCADESVHDLKSLDGLRERYDAVNIKLDKTGGLTEALVMADAAQALGFQIMIGCMVATSLAMAPAMLLTPSGPLRRSRWSAVAGARPRRRPALRRQPGLSARGRAVGMICKSVFKRSETGSRQENASNQEFSAPFRFYRNGAQAAPRRPHHHRA